MKRRVQKKRARIVEKRLHRFDDPEAQARRLGMRGGLFPLKGSNSWIRVYDLHEHLGLAELSFNREGDNVLRLKEHVTRESAVAALALNEGAEPSKSVFDFVNKSFEDAVKQSIMDRLNHKAVFPQLLKPLLPPEATVENTRLDPDDAGRVLFDVTVPRPAEKIELEMMEFSKVEEIDAIIEGKTKP